MEQPINIDGLSILALQIVFLAILVERAVGQIKKLAGCTLAKPWPAVAVALAAAVVFANDLPLIEYVTGIPSSKFGWLVNRILFALWIAGGAAAVIDALKDLAAKRTALHQKKLAG